MLFQWLFGSAKPIDMTKYLIVGLGNVGNEYLKTRHNIGFEVIDFLANNFEVKMTDLKLGAMGSFNHKGKKIILLKPSTLMNRSGKSVRYWALKEKIALQNILIVTDDLHLPFSLLRLKGKGRDGGHNGLKDIESQLNTTYYSRLRFGIKSEEKKFNQVNQVMVILVQHLKLVKRNTVFQTQFVSQKMLMIIGTEHKKEEMICIIKCNLVLQHL